MAFMKIEAIYQNDPSTKRLIPLFECSVSAGFPSPADDFIDKKLDLNEALIKHPAATFFVKVQGESMQDIGIFNQDLLIVDRSLNPKDGQVIVAVLNGEFTVKQIKRKNNQLFLVPQNKAFSPIEITKEMDFLIWGVVTYAIHTL